VDANSLVRLSNLSGRQESRLRTATQTRQSRKPAMTLKDYIAAKEAETAQ
jgi:hypothetical protein